MRERVKVPTITPTKLNNTTRSDQSQPNLRECSMFSQLYGRNIGVHCTIQMPIRAGLFDIKGSHRNFWHPKGGRVTVSGKPNDDAKPYQEREVRRAVEEAER